MKVKKVVAFLLVISLSMLQTATVFADAADQKLSKKFIYGQTINYEEYLETLEQPYYSSILAGYKEKGYKSADQTITVPINQMKLEDNKAVNTERNYQGHNGESFLWYRDDTTLTWQFKTESAGLYEIQVEYLPLKGSGNPVLRSFTIDNKSPFVESGSLTLPRMWHDGEEPVVNSVGDETRPRQIESSEWSRYSLIDGSGFYSQPFQFYFESGVHTFSMSYMAEAMAVGNIYLTPVANIKPYLAVKDEYIKNGYKEATGEPVFFQAESTAISKSDPAIRRESNSDPLVQPYSASYRKLNIIGEYRWRKGNQEITWEFEAPEDGLYCIGARAEQVWNDGIPSCRQIAIDGKVPFSEMLEYQFFYDSKWNSIVLSDENNEAYQFYFTKGKHTITMTVKMGQMAIIAQEINDSTLLLSQILMSINKLTGATPDPNYDYEFFTVIPTLKGDLQKLSDSMQFMYNIASKMAKRVPAMANNFKTIKTQIDAMIKDPYSIARDFGSLETAQSSLGAWYSSVQSLPLSIDYFAIIPPSKEWKNDHSNFWQKIKASYDNFMISFKKNYNNIGTTLDTDEVQIKDTIKVWVSRGIEWAEIIKEMADESFTSKNGILVDINVLPEGQMSAGNTNSMMLAIIAGRAPDVAIGVGTGDPVQFAIRDTVVDLSKFNNYNEVVSRFLPEISTPFKYRGGVYAIPETMNFNAMFYRKDIIANLAIPIPDTRADLYNSTLPALYQNSLKFCYPRDLSQYLFQRGGNYYTKDQLKSALDTPEAYSAFKELVELNLINGIPVTANFYNRFRQGIMPMGIGDFNTYMQLTVAAPELAGRWGIVPLPGTKRADGVVDRSNGTLTGQGDVIFSQSKKQEYAWNFIDWWTSAQVQTEFGRELEAVVGVEARWNTANIEAFANLPWNNNDLEIIKSQWKWAKETPSVLGGYYTSRYIDNAWTSVVTDGEGIRDSLENAVKEINKELRMKQEEYGYFKDETDQEE